MTFQQIQEVCRHRRDQRYYREPRWLGPLQEYSDTERKHSSGRFRDGESAAITNVFDTADAFPAFFAALAARDRGADDAIFESRPTRDELAGRDHLARLAGALDPVSQWVSNTVLALGGNVREVSTPAYAIARLVASVNPKVRAKLGPSTKFYAAAAAKGPRAQTRRTCSPGRTQKCTRPANRDPSARHARNPGIRGAT